MAGFSENNKHANKIRKKINKRREINKDIKRIAVFFSLCFIALIVYIIIFMSSEASSVINNSYNRRSDTLINVVKRGSILSSEGDVLAYTETSESGTETRIYPYSNAFSHIVGFNSNGFSGLESSYNYYLLSSHTNILSKIGNEFLNKKSDGDGINTTLKTSLQLKAKELLGENYGAIICMNPDTGEIYADVSYPDFDPNTIEEEWDNIVSDSANTVLLNRTTQGLYTPGSTFKLFTLYEYILENQETYKNFTYDCTGSITVGDTTISCLDGKAHGHQTLEEAFANSCNCAFAEIGKSLNIEKFTETCEKLLFNKEIDVDIASYESILNLDINDSEFDIMETAFGQGSTLMTPLHLCMVMGAIANEGICMKPHLVKSVFSPSGDVIKKFQIEEYAELFTKDEAEILKNFLQSVVLNGTASNLISDKYTAYGKTGTAETYSEDYGDFDHSWFSGWAEINEQKLAVCVIIENAESAGLRAANIAGEIFDFYFADAGA